MTVIIEVEQVNRRSPGRGAPDNSHTRGIPCEVVSPSFLAWIEDGDDLSCFRIAPFAAIAPTFIAVTAG